MKRDLRAYLLAEARGLAPFMLAAGCGTEELTHLMDVIERASDAVLCRAARRVVEGFRVAASALPTEGSA